MRQFEHNFCSQVVRIHAPTRCNLHRNSDFNFFSSAFRALRFSPPPAPPGIPISRVFLYAARLLNCFIPLFWLCNRFRAILPFGVFANVEGINGNLPGKQMYAYLALVRITLFQCFIPAFIVESFPCGFTLYTVGFEMFAAYADWRNERNKWQFSERKETDLHLLGELYWSAFFLIPLSNRLRTVLFCFVLLHSKSWVCVGCRTERNKWQFSERKEMSLQLLGEFHWNVLLLILSSNRLRAILLCIIPLYSKYSRYLRIGETNGINGNLPRK